MATARNPRFVDDTLMRFGTSEDCRFETHYESCTPSAEVCEDWEAFEAYLAPKTPLPNPED